MIERRDELPADAGARGISRRQLETVIRRAAEMYALEADADERLSEAEVLRIAEELGLPERHVRRALYELPSRPVEPDWVDSFYGPEQVLGGRVVPGPPTQVLARLEDYLVTREFLQVVRKHGGRASFMPADDAISNVARAVRRPQRQYHIARARKVMVQVRSIPEADSHVRLELDLGPQRRKALTGGLVGGAVLGLPLAAAAFFPIGELVSDVAGQAAGVAAGGVAGLGAFSASMAAGVALGRARFRNRLASARLELEGLLDRLQVGGRLDPPPAPWLRSLRSRIAGTLVGPRGGGA